MEEKRVLIGCPTYSGMAYCLDKFIDSINAINYQNKDILILDNSDNEDYYNLLKKINGIKVIRDKQENTPARQKIANSRNKIIEYALTNNYDYILMLDQDVIPPKEVIENLLSCRKDIVSGIYFNYFNGLDKPPIPVAWVCSTPEEFTELKKRFTFPPLVKSHKDIRRNLTLEEVETKNLMEVLIPAAGCMLISRKAFKENRYCILDLKSRGYKSSDVKTTDDIGFVENAHKSGFKTYCYTKVLCRHLVLNKYVKDKSGNLIYKDLMD